MAKLLNCVFCKKCNENLSLFTEETLKKCQIILKQRKKHNLKFKDVVLPVELFESGYHTECYSSFTGLMKKYYSEKSVTAQKRTQTENSLNITENTSTASTSSPLTISIVEDPSTASTSSPATSLLPEPIVIPEPTITSELPEPASSNCEGHCVQLGCAVDSLSQSNVRFESNGSIDENEQICIFCNQKTKKHRSKRLPLFIR